MKTIAVEDTLGNVKDYLEKSGYKVVKFTGQEDADAYVISGMDDDIMGMQDVMTEVPVIDADGKTPEEIVSSLRELDWM